MHADEDKQKKEQVEIRINAESLVAQTERTLKYLGEKVPADVKEKVDAKLKDLKDALEAEGTPSAELKEKTEALGSEIQQIGASMYGDADDPDVKVKDVSGEAEAETVEGEEVKEGSEDSNDKA